MAYWRESFRGNRMSSKWQATRLSIGGQNTGQWIREIRDGKLYWNGVALVTESGYWGEDLSLPVNAIGDIIIEARVRQRDSGVAFGITPVGVNQGVLGLVRYGIESSPGYWYGRNNGAGVSLPGFPSRQHMGPHGGDVLYNVRIVRMNGVMVLYMNNSCMGQYAYSAPITTVNIGSHWGPAAADWKMERWVHEVSVWPREVVL